MVTGLMARDGMVKGLKAYDRMVKSLMANDKMVKGLMAHMLLAWNEHIMEGAIDHVRQGMNLLCF